MKTQSLATYSLRRTLETTAQQIVQSPESSEAVEPTPAISHDSLLARSSILATKQYQIDFRALRVVVPPQNTPQVPFPTPQSLGFDLTAYKQVIQVLEVDPRTQLLDLTLSKLQTAEQHFKEAFPQDYEQKFEPILQTFENWVVLKNDVERYFDQIHEFIQDVNSINAQTIDIVGDLLIPPQQPPEDTKFDVADFVLSAAGTAVAIVGAFDPIVAISGELVLFAFSAAIAIESATTPSKWTPSDPEADRVQGLIAIRQRLVSVFKSALQAADSLKEDVLQDWVRLNAVSQLNLPHSQERAQALTAMTKAYERQVWRQLLPAQAELRYTKVLPVESIRLKSKNQDIESMRSVALSQFSARANNIIATRLKKEVNDPFTVLVARTGRAQRIDSHLNKQWKFVLGYFSYQLTRKNHPDQPVENALMQRILSSGITRRDLFEDFGLHSNGYPPLKPALNLEPMNDVRYNVYSESATYDSIELDDVPYLLSVNQTTQDLFISRWMPSDMATRLVATLPKAGPILKTFQVRDQMEQPTSFFLTANPTSGNVSIYHLTSKTVSGETSVRPQLDWTVPSWKGSTVYQPFELDGKTYLIVATPSTGNVWIKHIALNKGLITVRDAWTTDSWKGTTEYVPLYFNGQTYLLVASPEAGLAWIKQIVSRGDNLFLHDAWSVSGWYGSTVYVPVDMPNRTMFLVATPTSGNVWIKEMVVRGSTVQVEDRWSTASWKHSTQFKSFEMAGESYLAVSTPSTGRVWIKRLDKEGRNIRVTPMWATNWESGRREFLPMMVSAEQAGDRKTAEFHLIAPAVERGIAKDLQLDIAGDAHEFVLSSADLFELFPNPNLLLPS